MGLTSMSSHFQVILVHRVKYEAVSSDELTGLSLGAGSLAHLDVCGVPVHASALDDFCQFLQYPGPCVVLFVKVRCSSSSKHLVLKPVDN